MVLTLEETLEQAKKEWEEKQEERRKKEEKQRKLEKLRKIKPDWTKPQETGWSLLDKLFGAVIGIEESVYWAIWYSENFAIFRATKSGILASVIGIPTPEELHLVQLETATRKKIIELTLNNRRNPTDEFITKYGDPTLFCGCLSQALIFKKNFDPHQDKLLFFKWDRYTPDILKDLLNETYDFARCYGVAPIGQVLNHVRNVDVQFSYELSTGAFYSNPKYSLAAPLLQFVYPSSEGHNRLRDASVIIKETPYEYKTREITLNIGRLSDEFSDESRIAKKLDKTVQDNWQSLKELFEYWIVLNKALADLDAQYHTAQKSE